MLWKLMLAVMRHNRDWRNSRNEMRHNPALVAQFVDECKARRKARRAEKRARTMEERERANELRRAKLSEIGTYNFGLAQKKERLRRAEVYRTQIENDEGFVRFVDVDPIGVDFGYLAIAKMIGPEALAYDMSPDERGEMLDILDKARSRKDKSRGWEGPNGSLRRSTTAEYNG